MEKKTQEEQGSAVRGATGPDEAREAGRDRSLGMSQRAAGGSRCQSEEKRAQVPAETTVPRSVTEDRRVNR